MKPNRSHLPYGGLALAFFLAGLGLAIAQPSPAPAPANDNPPSPAAQESPPPAAPIPVPADPSTRPAPLLDPPAQPRPAGDGLIHLNFRGAPLDMVLDHLSEAAGFIIVKEAEVKGTVDVWSNQPLTKDEAVDLLNTILKQNDYAAVRNNRTLTIVKLDEAKKRNVPVKTGSKAENIPRNDEVVTQIIPVHYANALMLTQNLQPLLSEHASLSANESGNALVLTDTQASIRRMVEIVQALDTSISSIATIRVFPLRYADAKELAQVVTQLFEPPQQNRNDRRAQFFSQFGGRGGRGDEGGEGPRLPQSTGDNPARAIASRVIAMADERMNALIVAAPDEFITDIEQLVKQVDVPISDITELRVFRLENSDPIEMAALFKELFPDENATSQNQRGGLQGFPGFRFGRDEDNRRRNNTNTNTEDSERKKAASQVMAVADPRTSSLIVSAASELMPQIEAMIKQLDSSPAKKQKVYVYDLENADPTQVEQILRDMFERNTSQTSRSRNNAASQTSTLDNRRQNQNNANNGGGGFGNSGGIGGGNAFGGRGGGQTFP